MIRSLALTNWKSHESSKFEFTNGTNVLVGHMGSGKSSILQAVSFALFGTFAELKSRGLKIQEIVSKNSEVQTAEIELKIESNLGILTINRRINGVKGTTEATIRDESGKLLAGPNPTSANDFVTRSLRLDEAVFLRAVYGMQNEIDSVLRLSPGERKKRIDELMGLDKFEVARKSAGTLSSRIKTGIDATQRVVLDLDSEDIEKQESTLKFGIEKLRADQSDLASELTKKEEEERVYKSEVEHLRSDANKLNSILERIKSKDSQINEISVRLMGVDLQRTITEVERLESELKVKLSGLQDQKTRSSQSISEKNAILVETERNVAVCENRLQDLKRKLDEFQKIELELELVKSKHGVSDLRSEVRLIESEIKNKDEKVKINLAEMENLRRHLNELTSMEGLCPLCKSTLVESDRNKLISNTKKELAELLFSNNKFNEGVDKLKHRKNELDDIFEKYNKNIDDLSNKEKLRSEKNLVESEFESLAQKRSKAKEELFDSESILRNVEEEISKLLEKKDKLTRSKHLYELKSRKISLERELLELEGEKEKHAIDPNKINFAEEAFQRTLRKVQELRTRSEGIIKLLEEKKLRLGEVSERRERLGKLMSELKNLQSKVEFLGKFRNALQATQLELRDELILTVNEVMGSVWLEIYPYSTWSGVRLAVDENDYILQIKDADGSWVNVSGFASGGERMLAALAMRISFARVMVPNLSLLILDEPTHNLDERAIQTFIEVVQERITEFLDQILIVTHEEKLAESANNTIRL